MSSLKNLCLYNVYDSNIYHDVNIPKTLIDEIHNIKPCCLLVYKKNNLELLNEFIENNVDIHESCLTNYLIYCNMKFDYYQDYKSYIVNFNLLYPHHQTIDYYSLMVNLLNMEFFETIEFLYKLIDIHGVNDDENYYSVYIFMKNKDMVIKMIQNSISDDRIVKFIELSGISDENINEITICANHFKRFSLIENIINLIY